MDIAASWIERWLPAPIALPELAERLVQLGYEVVEMRALDAGLEPVHLVRVLDRRPHPARSRLSIVTIDTGSVRTEVVTGAANGFPGDLLWYAPPGTTLPDGRTLQTVEFAGVASPGMLCSAEELALRAGPGDLWVWTGGGTPGDRYLDAVGRETTLSIEMTPNLAQFAQSARGLARDLTAQGGERLPDLPGLTLTPVPGRVELRAADRCPAYALLAMAMPDAELPLSLQRQLRASGFRLVSPMVDWTNYVLMDTGQPLHAFDADRVSLPIVVRLAQDGEEFCALDGTTLALTADDLVIADQTGPIALAGVMGGLHSAINAETRRVLVESAHFAAPGIYRTVRRYGLRTDAAERYLRGTDPEVLVPALRRLSDLAGIEIAPEHVSLAIAGEPPVRKRVAYHPDRIRSLLSAAWSDEVIEGALCRLGFQVAGDVAVVPSWRPDVAGGADLAEEVGRLVGLDDIQDLVPAVTEPASWDAGHQFREQVRDLVASAGYTETLSRIFVNPKRRMPPGVPAPVHRLQNPIREEEGALRAALWPSLLDVLAFNRDRGVELMPLFEVSPAYGGGVDAPEQVWELAAVLPFGETISLHGRDTADVYRLTGLVDLLAARLRWPLQREAGDPAAFLHPGRQQTVTCGGAVVGQVGEIHPDVLEEYRLPPTGLLHLTVALPAAPSNTTPGRPSRYPPLTRDLSVIWPEGMAWATALQAVRDAGGTLLESCVPFDRYVGPFGQSLTVRLRFRSDERTLTEEEGDRLVADILAALGHLGVALRI